MNYLHLDSLKSNMDFIKFDKGTVEVVFSTAENNRSFNRNTKDGIKELNNLVNEFQMDDIEYLKQVHSNKVMQYIAGDKNFRDNEGDAVITNEKRTIIGVFTADCVPVILVDKKNNVIAAIHSGWKGTYDSITKETIIKMKEKFNSKPEDIVVYIGPHIRQCCYEVSEELKEKFVNKFNIDKDRLFNGRNLSLEECINNDLIESGVLSANINSLGICTYCEENIKVHSYRKSNGAYGRMFAFAYIK